MYALLPFHSATMTLLIMSLLCTLLFACITSLEPQAALMRLAPGDLAIYKLGRGQEPGRVYACMCECEQARRGGSGQETLCS